VKTWQGKRYWLVGSSEGTARSLAHLMSRAGVEVVVSAKNEARLQDLIAELPGRASYVPCDTADLDSVRDAIREVGNIDGVVYLADVHWPMNAKRITTEDAVEMCNVNLVGAMRVVGDLLPDMVAADSGHIVLTGSMAGFRGERSTIGYGASKAGVMTFAECLAADLRDTDIQVQLVNVAPDGVADNTGDAAARAIFEHMGTDQFRGTESFVTTLRKRVEQIVPDWLIDAVASRR